MARIAQFDTGMLADGYTLTEAVVYGYLRWCTWKTRWNDIEPSIGLMIKTLNISRCSVIRAVQKLEKTGLIEVYREYRHKNCYMVVNMEKYTPCSKFDYERMINPQKYTKKKRHR